jgi:hypothetical protein
VNLERKKTEINIKSNFSLVHLNIRSITNKFDHFKELLDSLNTEFKIIGLSETWLNDNTIILMMLVLIYRHITTLVQTEQIKKAEGLEYILQNN